MNPNAEPFVGDELISVVVSTYTVELHFQRDVIQIGGHFTLSRPGHADEQFEPEKQLGALQTLWPLIGRVVASTHWGPDWGDTVELVFDNAALIRILPVSEGFRGTIHGKFPPPGSLQIQDF
jgi:hypothetical protein